MVGSGICRLVCGDGFGRSLCLARTAHGVGFGWAGSDEWIMSEWYGGIVGEWVVIGGLGG
jgi:hypothetical protein